MLILLKIYVIIIWSKQIYQFNKLDKKKFQSNLKENLVQIKCVFLFFFFRDIIKLILLQVPNNSLRLKKAPKISFAERRAVSCRVASSPKSVSPKIRLQACALVPSSSSSTPEPFWVSSQSKAHPNGGGNVDELQPSWGVPRAHLSVFELFFFLFLRRQFGFLTRGGSQAIRVLHTETPVDHPKRAQERSRKHQEWARLQRQKTRRQDLRRSGRQARLHHHSPARYQGKTDTQLWHVLPSERFCCNCFSDNDFAWCLHYQVYVALFISSVMAGCLWLLL